MLVAFWNVGFLPPMEEWHSWLMPYPVLLAAQFAIIVLLGKVAWDFARGAGYFAVPNRKFGKRLLWFGWIYLTAMILRYVIRMSLLPEERWFGGTIPIFFHYVLASFVLLVAYYHRKAARAAVAGQRS
jgi:hypothetical protein